MIVSLYLTIKGHFCSLLISNIFCYPLFLYLSFAPSLQLLKAPNPFSLTRIPLAFVCTSHSQKTSALFAHQKDFLSAFSFLYIRKTFIHRRVVQIHLRIFALPFYELRKLSVHWPVPFGSSSYRLPMLLNSSSHWFPVLPLVRTFFGSF